MQTVRNDKSPRWRGGSHTTSDETAVSSSIVIPLADLRHLDGYCRVPLTDSAKLVQTVFGANVEVAEAIKSGDNVYCSLRYKHNTQQFPAKIQAPLDCWDKFEALLDGVHPVGVKLSCALYASANNREVRAQKNEVLRMLGLQTDRRGVQRSSSYQGLNRTISLFSCLYLPVYERKKKLTLIGYEPFLLCTNLPATKRYSRLHYRLGGEIEGRFCWLDKKWFAEDAGRHVITVMLYPFLVRQWEKGWIQHGGVFKWNVKSVFRDIGLPLGEKNYRRSLARLNEELAHMQSCGYVGPYDIDTCQWPAMLTVEAPQSQPLFMLRRGH